MTTVINKTPPWRYIYGLIAIVSTMVLAVCNVAEAWASLTDPLHQVAAATAMFIIVDLGVIGSLYAAVWCHRNSYPMKASLAAVLWLGFSGVSVWFSGDFINNMFKAPHAPIEARQAAYAEARDRWQTRWNTENEHMRAADQESLAGKTAKARADAKAEAAASRARLREIEAEDVAKPLVVTNAPVKHNIAGYGVHAALGVWFISQVCWFLMETAGQSAAGRVASQGGQSGQWLTVKDPWDTAIANEAARVASQGGQPVASLPGQGGHIENIEETNASGQDDQPERPASGQGGQPNRPGWPANRPAVLAIASSAPDETPEQAVVRLRQGGKSQEVIAGITGLSRAKVRRILDAAQPVKQEDASFLEA